MDIKIIFRAFVLTLIALLQSVFVCAENYPYRSDVLWVTVPDHADWIYKKGETATVEVQFYKYGVPTDALVEYEIAPDMLEAKTTGKVQLKNGRGKITVGTSKTPGFLDCRLKTTVDGTEYRHHLKVGFSPEEIVPYTQMPKDFDAFWTQTISDARKKELKVTSRKVEAYTTDKIDCYLVNLQWGSGRSIYGYLTRPKQEGKYPVVLCPPGAGIKTIKEPLRHKYYAENGFIRLEIEIHGLNPELSNETFGEISNAFNHKENGYLANGLDDKDNYYMKRVYEACVRSIDYLTSLSEWDGKNVIVQGGSQGGALAIVTAGLDKRLTQCVVNHPALSDMAGYLKGTGGYPHFNKMNNMLTPEKVQTLAYYDVVNFARRVQCPVYMTWGYSDSVCPPTTSYAVYNVLQCEKEALITPINEHWTSEATEYGHMLWIKKHLK